MIKVYTPERWLSAFNHWPSLIIEDDGLIYSEEEYHKLLRNPIGQIDYDKGLIYGADYLKYAKQPIGAIKTDGDVTKIYGQDYFKVGAWPILYIRENRVFSSDEYFKLFPSESAYISGEIPVKEKQGASAPSPDASPVQTKQAGARSPSFLGSMLKVLLAGGALLALFVIMTVAVFSGNALGQEETLAAYIAVACGAVAAFIFAKNAIHAIMITGITGGLIIYVIDIVYTLFWQGGYTLGTFFMEVILGPFVLILIFAIPAILVGLLVWWIKSGLAKVFKKEKSV